MIEAISGPGWTANFCSLDSSSSGITWNSWNPVVPPIRNPFPCFFETLKKIDDKMKIFFLYSWNWLGGLASNLTKTKFCECHEPITAFLCDRILTEEALKIIEAEEDWDVLVIYFMGVDETGHMFNWGSSQYKEAIGMVDSHIGRYIFYILSSLLPPPPVLPLSLPPLR